MGDLPLLSTALRVAASGPQALFSIGGELGTGPGGVQHIARLRHYVYFLGHNLRCRLRGERRPLLAGFKLTHRCNLRCAACPFWRRPAGDLAYERALACLEDLHRAGARLVIFEGGEPFLWRDGARTVEDLVQVARRLGYFAAGITTNGTLPLDTSADVLWVSIDGPRAVHDAWRGPSYDRIMANIAASGHPHLLANVTITRHNVRHLAELVHDLKGIVKGITIQFAYPYPDSEDLTVSPGVRRAALDELIALKRRGYPLLDSYGVLERLRANTWRCHDWLLANVEPDGRMSCGCYLKGRGAADCRMCGFAAHAELSRAFDWDPAAIVTGQRVFGF